MSMTVKRSMLVLILGVSFGCTRWEECPPRTEPVVASITPDGRRLDQFIRTELGEAFSGTILVERRGRILLHAAYGYADPRGCIPAEPHHAYWIGSLSKQFAATAIMKLTDQGRLKLSDRIGDYFPGVPPDKAQITVSQLLTHTSGLSNKYLADGISQRHQAVRAVLAQQFEPAPGQPYRYSNDAYSLAAAIIEIASEQSFEAYLNEQLFQPVGLTGVGSAGDQQAWNRLQVAERALGASKGGSPQFWEPDWGYKGGTGILATAADLRLWFHAVWESKVLTPKSTELLFSAQIETKRQGLSYAYGWYRLRQAEADKVVILHNGDDDFIGHSSSLRWDTQQELLVIVVSNSGYWDGRGVAGSMAARLEEQVLLPD